MDINQLIQTACVHHKNNQWIDAENLYRTILAIEPKHGDANHNMGVLAIQLGKPEAALQFLKTAVEAHPSVGQYWLSYCRGLLASTKVNDALSVLDQAQRLGLKGEAADVLRKEIETRLRPSTAPELKPQTSNNANTSMMASKFEQEVLKRPFDAAPRYNLGVALREQGKIEDAARNFEKAIELKPDFAEAINNLGFILAGQGHVLSALKFGLRSLAIRKTATNRALIVFCLRDINIASLPTSETAIATEILVRALKEGWDRPSALLHSALMLIKADSAYVELANMAITESAGSEPSRARYDISSRTCISLAGNSLLQCVLQLAPIPDLMVENVLMGIRSSLLQAALHCEILPEFSECLPFYCALARQCFINEYIYEFPNAESEQVKQLLESLDDALAINTEVNLMRLVSLASYMPLHKLSRAEELPSKQWHPAIQELLEEQVSKPLQEKRLRATIAVLTPLDDEVSVRVQTQYEEFPYPTWVRTLPAGEVPSLETRIHRQFPLAPLAKQGNTRVIDVLIAGCGTGRQSIECAQEFPKARILAVDLSLASLAYAQRMTNEARIGNISYGQADLLKLGSFDKQFDLIEAVGVLHHLRDPSEGWRILLSLLRPGGFMRIGLYSELARQDVVAARKFIAEHHYASTTEGIRQCRKAMFSFNGDASWKPLFASEDFFSTSSCRDLIFHVQEKRFTLPQIASFLSETGLTFIGFDMNPKVLATYRSRFPEDPAGRSLEKWHEFECANPATFKGMYQFYVQKP